MNFLILLCMFFCHIVDDYYLQGWLASGKQQKWWMQNAPQEMYKHDYIMALAEHAFSWAFMIHVPIMLYMLFNKTVIGVALICSVIIDMVIHAVVDNAKANELIINLVQDQMIHFFQIIATWLYYCVMLNI